MAIIKSAETDFGRVLVNQKENDGYAVDYPSGGEVITAHSNSIVELELERDALIQGGLGTGVEAFAFQHFKINGETVGKLKESDYETFPAKIKKGVVRLEISAHNNTLGHAFWRIDENFEQLPLKIAVACGNDRFVEKIDGCETMSTGYQTDEKNFATLVNEAVDAVATNSNASKCVVAICDVESAIEKSVLAEVSGFVSDERCIVIPKRILTVKKGKNKSENPEDYHGIGAIVVTLNAWDSLSGFDERVEGFAKAAENFVARFCARQGCVVKRPVGFEGVAKYHPNVRKNKIDANNAGLDWGTEAPVKKRATVKETLTEPAIVSAPETKNEDDVQPKKKKSSSRKTNTKEKKDEE